MEYSWIQESLKKYGEEVTSTLIKLQKTYEKENEQNDCHRCGKGNEGAIVEWPNGPQLMHPGVWVDGNCSSCGRHMDE